MLKLKNILCILLVFLMTSCSKTSNPQDPMESMNRAIFRFNLALNDYILVPVSKFYDGLVPNVVQDRVTDELYTLRLPLSGVSYLLSGDLRNTAKSAVSFVVNMVLGFFGMCNVSRKIGIAPATTNMDGTLKSYGAKSGHYVVLPLVGPSSPRDVASRLLSFCVNPLYVLVGSVGFRNGVFIAENGVDVINSKVKSLPMEQEVRRESEDIYVTLRSMYLQKANSGLGEKEEFYIDEEDL